MNTRMHTHTDTYTNIYTREEREVGVRRNSYSKRLTASSQPTIWFLSTSLLRLKTRASCMLGNYSLSELILSPNHNNREKKAELYNGNAVSILGNPVQMKAATFLTIT